MTAWAKVPIDLLSAVDGGALRVYVALCSYARQDGRCWPSDAALAERAGVSASGVSRGLRQLAAAGYVTRSGRRRRILTVTPVGLNSVTAERIANPHPVTGDESIPSPVTDGSRTTEVDIKTPLRDVLSDESEGPMQSADEEPMFEVDRLPEKPRPTAQACMAAFFDAYGAEPIDRREMGKLSSGFKAASETYAHDELVAAAREMGEQKITNPRAIGPFVLRRRQPRHVAQQQRAGWSQLAADTFAASGDPFAADV